MRHFEVSGYISSFPLYPATFLLCFCIPTNNKGLNLGRPTPLPTPSMPRHPGELYGTGNEFRLIINSRAPAGSFCSLLSSALHGDPTTSNPLPAKLTLFETQLVGNCANTHAANAFFLSYIHKYCIIVHLALSKSPLMHWQVKIGLWWGSGEGKFIYCGGLEKSHTDVHSANIRYVISISCPHRRCFYCSSSDVKFRLKLRSVCVFNVDLNTAVRDFPIYGFRFCNLAVMGKGVYAVFFVLSPSGLDLTQWIFFIYI